jgi:CHAD domain-containing protein
MSASANTAIYPVKPATPIRALDSAQRNAGKRESWEWAKLRKIALRQMDKFIDLLPLVFRNEDLTAVNRMRVTCRRLEEIVDLVYVKPRPSHIKKLRRRLRLCRKTLGKLRNCDALLALAKSSIAAKRPGSDAWESLQDYLQQSRARIAAVSLEKLGRVNLALPYLRMKRDFSLTGKGRGNTHKAATHAAAGIVYRRIVRSLDDRWRNFADAVEKSRHDPCEHVIHGMRIAAKRLRYLTEVMAKLHIEGSKEALDWLKSVQVTIGTWHDLEIMERMLRDIVIHRNSFHVEHMVVEHIERLIRHNQKIKRDSAERFFQITRHSRDYQQVKQWVELVLAFHPKKVPPLGRRGDKRKAQRGVSRGGSAN